MKNASVAFRTLTAAGLLLAGSLGWAASPSAVAEAVAIDALQDTYERVVTPGEEAGQYRELLDTVLKRFKRSSATQVDLSVLAGDAAKAIAPTPLGTGEPAAVFRKAIQAALQPIDSYSRYYDPQAWASERSDGSFVGLGIEVEAGENSVRIVAPIPDGPAEKAGLRAGDLIVQIDNQTLVGVPLADAITRMRGERGTAVSVTVQRTGTPGPFTVSLTRDTIRRKVLTSSVEGDVLVLRLASFGGTASSAIEQAVAEATAQRAPKGVVLDLRGNPGGLLREGVKVADAFLSTGEIASLYSNGTQRGRVWQADAAELLPGVPMVVLIDGRSASASELAADALQHNGRATVMGQRSYGKGSVQTTFGLGEQKGALKLTTSLYHGPSGKTVHKIGVSPDIELMEAGKAEPTRTMRAPDAPPARDAKARVDSAHCAPVKAADPALACALAYLKAGNVEAFVAALAAH